MKTDTTFIDEWFDEIEDPVVSNMGLIGLMETWIHYSIFDDNQKEKLIEKIEKLRESQVPEFMDFLKDHRVFPDPKDQFAEMTRRGVFN